MDRQVLNHISQSLAYRPISGVTDNPSQRSFDWTRKIYSIAVFNPKTSSVTIPSGQSVVLFDGTRPNPLDGTSVLSLSLLTNSPGVYRLSVNSGSTGFKTARSISGVTGCTVSINNGSLANFDFTGATLTGVAVGDILRINGAQNYDTGPFAFNPLNSGSWVIVGIQGTILSCTRPSGIAFQGVNESVASAAADVSIYAQDGVQDGDKIDISGVFSLVSQRVYTVKTATPNFIDFVSTQPLPNENNLTYTFGSVTFYVTAKKFIGIEVNQDAIVRYNDDTGNSNRVSPISPGDMIKVGWIEKWGDTYKCVVVNKSVNPLDVRFFTTE